MKKYKHFLIFLLTVMMCFTSSINAVNAVAKPKLNMKKATLEVGQKITLKLNNATSVKWSSSDKSVARVSSKGLVKAVKPGTAKITAMDKKTKKNYVCKLTVIEQKPAPDIEPEPENTIDFVLYNKNSKAEIIDENTNWGAGTWRHRSVYTIKNLKTYIERTKGIKISASATWEVSDDQILYFLHDLQGFVAVGHGKVVLTIVSASKTYKYNIEVVKEDPYALTYEDFTLQNVVFTDTGNKDWEVVIGKSTNFIDIFPDNNAIGHIDRYVGDDPDDPDYNVFLHRGIRLGSTLKEVYEAYGCVYTLTPSKNLEYLNSENHTVTTQIIMHYGIKEKDICYQIGMIFDQNDILICYSMGPHKYH